MIPPVLPLLEVYFVSSGVRNNRPRGEGELWTETTVENQRIRHVMDAEALKNDGRKGGKCTLNSKSLVQPGFVQAIPA